MRKSFLSIKGIYYQATIQGQDILWLVPYKFVQQVTGDVDFRIMGTFIEFYATLLGFVNYRLYNSIGLVYPPKFNQESDEQGGELGAFVLEGRGVRQQELANGNDKSEQTKQISSAAQAEADKLMSSAAADDVPPSSYMTAPETASSAEAADNQEPAESEALESFPQPIDPNSDALLQPAISSDTAAALFAPFTFYLSRETPRHSLEFILRAFGCKRVGWDAILGDGAFTSDEGDRRITHQIVDRPSLPMSTVSEEKMDEETAATKGRRLRPGERVPGRIYLQPQWVWDCINAGRLLRTDLYAPGAVLPPHLSPWVKAKKGEYDPTKPLAEQETAGEVEAAAEAELAEEDEEELERAIEEEADANEDTGSEGEEVGGVRDDSEAREMESDLLSRGGKEVVSGEGMDVELGESDEDSDDEVPDAEFGGFDSEEEDEDEDDDIKAARQHQRELEAEARGAASPAPTKVDAGSTPGKALKKKVGPAQQQAARRKKEEDEEVERQKMMMSRRKRKLFEKMQYSNQKKDAEAEKLRAKRRKFEKGGAVAK